jgi:hypothetical protein
MILNELFPGTNGEESAVLADLVLTIVLVFPDPSRPSLRMESRKERGEIVPRENSGIFAILPGGAAVDEPGGDVFL